MATTRRVFTQSKIEYAWRLAKIVLGADINKWANSSPLENSKVFFLDRNIGFEKSLKANSLR